MGDFQRSPSKVWWLEDSQNWRSNSASPGSQDSGFSDTESSPTAIQKKLDTQETEKCEEKPQEEELTNALEKSIRKGSFSSHDGANLNSSFKEKSTPKKSVNAVMQQQRLYQTKEIILTTPIEKLEVRQMNDDEKVRSYEESPKAFEERLRLFGEKEFFEKGLRNFEETQKNRGERYKNFEERHKNLTENQEDFNGNQNLEKSPTKLNQRNQSVSEDPQEGFQGIKHLLGPHSSPMLFKKRPLKVKGDSGHPKIRGSQGKSLETTPKRPHPTEERCSTEPISRSRAPGNFPGVSRNLFKNILVDERSINKRNLFPNDGFNQYSRRQLGRGTPNNSNVDSLAPSSVEDIPLGNDNSYLRNSYGENSEDYGSFNELQVKTFHGFDAPHPDGFPANLTAPAVLYEEVPSREQEENSFRSEDNRSGFSVNKDDSLTSFHSDSDSELESLFSGLEHTSTPKAGQNTQRKQRSLLMRKREIGDPSTRLWMKEARFSYEAECMTALQCKSLAGELADKVGQLASSVTLSVRDLLSYGDLIEKEFETINQKKQAKPLAESLADLMEEFLNKYSRSSETTIHETCRDLRTSSGENLTKSLTKLHLNWKNFHKKLLAREVKKLVEELEDPHSEMHVRAMLTGLTSIALRNEDLVTMFTQNGAVQILAVLCEKCEGSTVRQSALRALTTICSNASAIRQFEKSWGIQLILDVLQDEGRPEPERSEAAALLAQVTAPWIEDNHSVQGLTDHDRKLVKALTKFLTKTKCCQNLLLCTAALANLSTMDPSSIRFIIKRNTIGSLLKAVRSRGPQVSVYLLEQTATLIANVSTVEEGRKQLVEEEGSRALLCFLKASCLDNEVVKRLQQKSMIALSRLCSERKAAEDVVALGGVDRLVELCREKELRFNSDAVLVAALATLRKINEMCGKTAIDEQDAQELVEPRLLDSFLAYSSQNESYV